MSFHFAAFSQNVDQALGAINVVADPQITITNSNEITVKPQVSHILGLMPGAPSLEYARVVAPSLYRQFQGGGPDIPLLNVGAEPLTPSRWTDWRDRPLQLDSGDKLQLHIENDVAGGAEDAWGLMALAAGPISPAPGPWRTMRFQAASAALTAEAWTNKTLTSRQTLQPGVYAVGGGVLKTPVSGTGTIRAFRLAGLMNPNNRNENLGVRPGALASDTMAFVQDAAFRNGGLGTWGLFTHDALPTVDIFADAADNVQEELFLDVIKVG